MINNTHKHKNNNNKQVARESGSGVPRHIQKQQFVFSGGMSIYDNSEIQQMWLKIDVPSVGGGVGGGLRGGGGREGSGVSLVVVNEFDDSFVGEEDNCGIGYDSEQVRAHAPIQPSHPLLPPHHHQCLEERVVSTGRRECVWRWGRGVLTT